MLNETNPYLVAFAQVKLHDGTSGQTCLAKCILSLCHPIHAFSMGEILGPLDEHYTRIVLNMVKEYASVGETEELRQAGKWVYENFEGLVELSHAMCEARREVRSKWTLERAAAALDDES